MGPKTLEFDIVVVGGGHNGLTAAVLLASKGFSVAVVEASSRLGGLASNYSPWPGFTAPRGAYVLGLYPRWIMKALGIHDRIRLLPKEPNMVSLLGGGRAVRIYGDPSRTSRELSRFSERDARAYVKWARAWGLLGALLEELYCNTPMSLEDSLKSLASVHSVPIVGRRVFQALEEHAWMLAAPASRILGEWFESWEARAALVEDALVGELAGPSTPGTGLILAHHYLGVSTGVRGEWAYVKGGMGALIDALASRLKSLGGYVFTGERVVDVLARRERVYGVLTSGGLELLARNAVLWAASVKSLIEPAGEVLDKGLKRRLGSLDSDGASSKLIIALKGLPKPQDGYAWLGEDLYRSSVITMPGLEYAERAYGDALSRGISREPWLSINVLSRVDPSLAPEGWSLTSVFLQYTRGSSRKWGPGDREEVLSNALNVMSEYFYLPKPGKGDMMVDVITPGDYDALAPGGHIFHISMRPDQIYMWRPLPELSNYKVPGVDGLYLAGSSSHPGGGVSGIPGFLGASRLLSDLTGSPMPKPRVKDSILKVLRSLVGM